jgi:hypothetical protein
MFTADEVEEYWRGGGDVGAEMTQMAKALGLPPGALPRAVPSFLAPVQYEFLMAGLQMRLVARMEGGDVLLHRLKAVAAAEAGELSRLAPVAGWCSSPSCTFSASAGICG